MNEKVENLVLEQFRVIRPDIGQIKDDIRTMRVEMTAMRLHVRGIEVQQDAHHDDIASLKNRIDRIKRRLELVGDGEK